MFLLIYSIPPFSEIPLGKLLAEPESTLATRDDQEMFAVPQMMGRKETLLSLSGIIWPRDPLASLFWATLQSASQQADPLSFTCWTSFVLVQLLPCAQPQWHLLTPRPPSRSLLSQVRLLRLELFSNCWGCWIWKVTTGIPSVSSPQINAEFVLHMNRGGNTCAFYCCHKFLWHSATT